MEYTEYTTVQGQRWDTIADITLGDPYGYVAIAEANPQWISTAIFPGGAKLLIPAIDQSPSSIPLESLPPWKR